MHTILHIERSEQHQEWLSRTKASGFKSALFEREVNALELTKMHWDDLRALLFEVQVCINDCEEQLRNPIGNAEWAERAERYLNWVTHFRWGLQSEIKHRKRLYVAQELKFREEHISPRKKRFDELFMALLDMELGEERVRKIRERAGTILEQTYAA
jgi:hypothetical protein